MAFDPDPQLRAELDLAVNVLLPQIAGLQHLVMVSSLPADLIAELNSAATSRSHRLDLILAVLQALDAVVFYYEALIADGYPTLTPVPLLPAVSNELTAELAVLEAAVGVFRPDPPVEIGLDLSNLTTVPQAVPIKPGP
jgi:hypothetical protein